MGQRKKYTPEYRIEAARLVIDTGRSIAEVARELGVGEQLLGRWVRAEHERSGATGGPNRASSWEGVRCRWC